MAEWAAEVRAGRLRRVEGAAHVRKGELEPVGPDRADGSGRDVGSTRHGDEPTGSHRAHPTKALFRAVSRCYPHCVATILVAGVDLYFRGKLDALLGGRHRLVTTDSVDPPDLVIVDIARVDPEEVAESWPDIPILGYTNHTDTAGLRAAQAAGFDRVVVRSALAERAPQIVEELVG